MCNSSFNPEWQNASLSAKITSGLERIASLFKVLLWEQSKTTGLSPIQIQLIIFIRYHDDSLCNVSYLASEFNLTKATVSDAIRILQEKKLIKKVTCKSDKRKFSVMLTKMGKELEEKTEHYAEAIEACVSNLREIDKVQLFSTVRDLIFKLNKAGILTMQRICFTCKYYEEKSNEHFCHFIDKSLMDSELRIDCPDYIDNSIGNRCINMGR